MSQSITKPTAPTFYRSHGPGVIHEGVTDPGMVTTTSQPNFIHSADPGEFARLVAASGSSSGEVNKLFLAVDAALESEADPAQYEVILDDAKSQAETLATAYALN